MGEFQQLFDADAGVAECLDDRPFPEGGVLLECDVDAIAGRLITQPHVSCPEVLLAAVVGVGEQTPVGAAPNCDRRVRVCGLAGGQQLGEAGVLGVDMLGQRREQRLAVARPVGHPLRGPSPSGRLAPGLGVPDGAGSHPVGPHLGFLRGPGLHVVVEGPHRHQDTVLVEPRAPVGLDSQLGAPLLVGLGRQPEVVLAWVDLFHPAPERADQ